jgi:hypothetical protein
MLTFVFEKTEKGREEIATRQHQLPPRLRSLLLLVDGKQSGAQLLSRIGATDQEEDSLTDLLREGFIFLVADALDPQEEPLQTGLSDHGVLGIAESIRNPQQQLQAVRAFYLATIKEYLGLRGYLMRRKVEKAPSMAELRALRADYLRAIFIAKGEDTARRLRDQLDPLLN